MEIIMVHLKYEVNINGNKWTKQQRVGLLPLGPCWNRVLALFDFCQIGKMTKDDDKTYLKCLQIRGGFRESDAQMKMTSHSDSTPFKLAFQDDKKCEHMYSLDTENEGHILSECLYVGNCAKKY